MKNLKKDILKLRNEGKTYNEISEILNCSKGTISFHCSNINDNKKISSINKKLRDTNQIKKLPEINFGKEIDEEIIKKIIFLRKKGNSYDKIFKETNISLDKIKKICRDKQITDNTEYQKPTIDEIKEMKLYYDKVKNLKKVASKFDWCYSTVRKYIEPTGRYAD